MQERDEKGRLRGADYVIFELPQPVPAYEYTTCRRYEASQRASRI